MFKYLSKEIKKKSLEKKYTVLLIEAHQLSETNPSASLAKSEAARKVLNRLDKLN